RGRDALALPRPHPVRTAGAMGGLARRLAPDAALPVVELPRPLLIAGSATRATKKKKPACAGFFLYAPKRTRTSTRLARTRPSSRLSSDRIVVVRVLVSVVPPWRSR